MKFAGFVFALALVLGFTSSPSQASDRKIGSLVAVERTINSVYQNCVEQIPDEESSSSLYSCKFDTRLKNVDFTPGTARLLTLNTSQCFVEGTLQNSLILIMFSSKTKNTDSLTASKACLRQALESSPHKDSFKVITYTME